MRRIFSLAFILASIVFTTSCTKSNSTPATTTPGANGSNTFTWVDGTTTHNCDSAYASANFKTIFVYKGGTASRFFFEINLSSLAVGNYTVSGTGANAIAYIRPANATTYQAVAGGVQITANANNTITGTGVASITTMERVNFTFTNLPIR
jgi:hypothetical protein